MEAALESEDPRLVSTMTGKARTPRAGRLVKGLLLTLAGLALLLAGLMAKTVAVGIAGFLVSLVGLVLIFSNLGGGHGVTTKKGGSAGGPKKPKWSDRLEERWERRNFDQ
jgi:uncharacterized membrane protein HdeD (DUF308 family)